MSSFAGNFKAIKTLEANRETIAACAREREDENDSFRMFLTNLDGSDLDEKVHEITNTITPLIDCTACGACCKNLMINLTEENILPVANNLGLSIPAFKEQYVEESSQGQMIMNTIPCHFLNDNKCTVYADRFTECREFPHLHKNNFKGRLFGTLMHYAMCPIIFNVIETLKVETGFVIANTKCPVDNAHLPAVS